MLVVAWLNYAPARLQPGMPIFAADALLYDAVARNIRSGAGFQIEGGYQLLIAPGFPTFLAALYSLWGPSVVGTGLANALLGALTAVVLFFLVRDGFAPAASAPDNAIAKTDSSWGDDFAERVAFAAALMFAAYPFEIFNTPYVLKENFSIFLTAAFALGWMRMLRVESGRAQWWAVGAGLLLGLSVLSRFAHLGLIVPLLLVNIGFIWRRKRQGNSVSSRVLASNTGWLLLAFGLTLAPWLARNYNVWGQVVLSPHGAGRYLYNANSDLAEPEANGYYEGRGKLLEHNTRLDREIGNDVTARERIYARKALGNFLSRPGHVARLMGAKLINMWRPVWGGSSWRTWLVLGLPYVLMMALALPGLWLVSARRHTRDGTARHPFTAVLYALVLFYFLGHLVFYAMIRERQYVEPYLMAFAAYALVYWRERRALKPASLHND